MKSLYKKERYYRLMVSYVCTSKLVYFLMANEIYSSDTKIVYYKVKAGHKLKKKASEMSRWIANYERSTKHFEGLDTELYFEREFGHLNH